jgi:murein DD-endopeptidase MepM/ murein hydrolase activator NlpD
MKSLLLAVLVALVGFACWIGGSVYPAPSALIAALRPAALLERTRSDLKGIDWNSLQSLIGREQAEALGREAVRLAASAGSVITIEHESDADSIESGHDTVMAPSPSPSAPPAPVAAAVAPPAPQAAPAAMLAQESGGFETSLNLCPRMTIRNAPPSDGTGNVRDYTPRVLVNGAVIAVDPTRDTCLSSGFGTRNGKLHKGLDFHSEAGGPILAAGDGAILEMKYRDDYGNTLLIDHGNGVYTRYSHLSSFRSGLMVGSKVRAGAPIGLMGNTAAYPIPLHLHYELLLGDYANPKASFGLTPHSPFEYHSAG